MKCENFIARNSLRRRFLFTLLLSAFFILTATRTYSQFPYPYNPLFQYAIFYNVNLEIDPGASFPILAPVFCNSSIWSGNANPTYSSTVWAVGSVITSGTDPFADGKVDSGTPPNSFKLAGQPVSGVAPILFPVFGMNNLHSMLDLPPPDYALGTANAYTTNGLAYLANAAGLIISNSISGTNWNGVSQHTNFIAVYYQDSTYVSNPLNGNPRNLANSVIWVTNDFYILSNAVTHTLTYTNYISPGTGTNILYAGYSFLTNVLFYDWREGWNGGSGIGGKGKPIQAVQFNVTNFNKWLTSTRPNGGSNYNQLSQNHWHHSIGGIYIYNSVTNTTTILPAVRVINGAQLFDSYGLTIATPFPLYVLGDYNTTDSSGTSAGQNSTTHARPAAFMADSITVLSSSWSDGTTTKLPSPTSVNTINAAFLEGIVPSDPSIAYSDGSSYSGGAENFVRLLENWSSHTLYYNGSIVVLFSSQYATNRWRQTGNFYGAPVREWAFDTNFTAFNKMPPLTPIVINSNSPPSITVQPLNLAILSGQTTNFIVMAAGVPAVNYQWNFDGTNISGSTNISLTLTNVPLSDAGNYAVQATNVFGSITSSNATLSVYASAVPAINTFSFSTGNGAGFTVAGVPGYNYAVQSSTNLIDWVSLITNTSPFIFTDTNAPNFPQQFYRSVYLP